MPDTHPGKTAYNTLKSLRFKLGYDHLPQKIIFKDKFDNMTKKTNTNLFQS